MKSTLAAFFALAGLSLATAFTPATAKTFNNVVGASGDARARDECASGEYLTGLQIRSGAWLDQLAIICAAAQPDGTTAGENVHSARGGGGGTGPTKYACPSNQIVHDINFITTEDNRQVSGITLHCVGMTGVGFGADVNAPPKFSGQNSYYQGCPEREAATGFDIRFGRHVNAIGLICNTLKLPPPPVVASAPPLPPCPDGQFRFNGVCQVPKVLPGSTTGEGGGFIQMFPTCPDGKILNKAEKKCVAETPPPGGEAAPAPMSGGGLTASTCGLSGLATVVIPDPALTTLNVRDKPEGTILTKIPENAQVDVVGACGSQLSAGIVAPKVIPGWCAISAPVTGCVAEQFLVAGGSGSLPMGSAGIVANKPVQQQQPQTAPEVVTAAPPVVVAPVPVGGGQAAQLTQGANIRNEPSGSEKDKNGKKNVLGSLPGGSTVTVLECNKSWCRISHPQFPNGWVSRKFVQMTGVAVTVQIVTPPAGTAAAPALPTAGGGGGGLTASTCGLSGTATVVIPDPALTTLNVRDKPNGNILSKIPENAQVKVVGGCGVQLSAGIVAQQTPVLAPVPGWCAIAEPVIGCVSEQFLVAGVQAANPVGAGSAGLVATEPQTGAAPSFTGTWSAEAQGSSYSFTLNQNGNSVTGSYSGSDGSNGQLNGNASGKVLRFSWSQTDGLSGAGKFTLSGDGNSFNGSYTLGNNPDIAEGSWNGTRQ